MADDKDLIPLYLEIHHAGKENIEDKKDFAESFLRNCDFRFPAENYELTVLVCTRFDDYESSVERSGHIDAEMIIMLEYNFDEDEDREKDEELRGVVYDDELYVYFSGKFGTTCDYCTKAVVFKWEEEFAVYSSGDIVNLLKEVPSSVYSDHLTKELNELISEYENNDILDRVTKHRP